MDGLSCARLARIPTHDPLVGRVVGDMLAGAKRWDRAVNVQLSGDFDGHRMTVTFERQDDGSVSADGRVGDLEIHERYERTPSESWGASDTSRLFGVAGSDSREFRGRLTGTVGQHQVEASLATERVAREIALTPELASRARQVGRGGSAIGLSPQFGGAQVTTNLVPAPYPTATTPMEATDHLAISGRLGEASFARDLSWTTTMWTVVYNDEQGFAWSEYQKVSDGTQTDSTTVEGAVTVNDEPLQFLVSQGPTAECSGVLRHQDQNGSEDVGLKQSYRYLREKGGLFHVEERLGEHSMDFDIYYVDDRGVRTHTDPQSPEERHRTVGAVEPEAVKGGAS